MYIILYTFPYNQRCVYPLYIQNYTLHIAEVIIRITIAIIAIENINKNIFIRLRLSKSIFNELAFEGSWTTITIPPTIITIITTANKEKNTGTLPKKETTPVKRLLQISFFGFAITIARFCPVVKEALKSWFVDVEVNKFALVFKLRIVNPISNPRKLVIASVEPVFTKLLPKEVRLWNSISLVVTTTWSKVIVSTLIV